MYDCPFRPRGRVCQGRRAYAPLRPTIFRLDPTFYSDNGVFPPEGVFFHTQIVKYLQMEFCFSSN